MGLYDVRSGAEPDSRDEQKVKDFMIQKYERKRYYIAPTDAMKEEAKQANEAAISKQPTTRPLKSLLGEKTPTVIVNQSEQVNFKKQKQVLFLTPQLVQRKDTLYKLDETYFLPI